MELLRCEKLSKIYGRGEGRVTALDEIDLSVEGGIYSGCGSVWFGKINAFAYIGDCGQADRRKGDS